LNGYLLAGFSLGLLLIAAYVRAAVRRDERPELALAIVLMLSALTIASGVKVIVLCVTAATVKPFADEDRVYIALGGIALLWVSLISIQSAFGSRQD